MGTLNGDMVIVLLWCYDSLILVWKLIEPLPVSMSHPISWSLHFFFKQHFSNNGSATTPSAEHLPWPGGTRFSAIRFDDFKVVDAKTYRSASPFVLRTFPSKWPKVEVGSSLLYKKPVHIKSRRDSDTSNRAGGMVIWYMFTDSTLRIP